MTKAKISVIAAITEKTRALGKDNKLLWQISDDLKRFKKITTGHPIIMGRKTFESIGRALPNRTNIIITRNPDFKPEGCIVVNSLEAAISKAQEEKRDEKTDQSEIFIIGGAEIYKQALVFADKLYLTIIHNEEREKDADVFFPDYSNVFKKEVFKEQHLDAVPSYTFVELER